MSRYRFELATREDDADLRHIMASTPMDGAVVVSFRREPSYFDAAVVEGRFRQVVAARDLKTDRIVGFGARSISPRFVNGEPTPIGYLSSLRLLPKHRNIGLVARGYRYFRELHADGRTPLYLTTIATENRAAVELLTSGRAGLPRYLPAGDFFTFAIPTGSRWGNPLPPEDVHIRTATDEDLPAIADFLKVQSRRRQFFPQYCVDDFGNDQGSLRGLWLCDLRIALSGFNIVGVVGAWNQQRFRQTVIEEYRGALQAVRPVLNWTAKFLDRPQLPEPGSTIGSVFAAMLLADGDNPEVVTALVSRLLSDIPRSQANYLLVGMHESDPCLPVARSFGGRCYTTRLYLVTWDNERELVGSLDGRPVYLELGAL